MRSHTICTFDAVWIVVRFWLWWIWMLWVIVAGDKNNALLLLLQSPFWEHIQYDWSDEGVCPTGSCVRQWRIEHWNVCPQVSREDTYNVIQGHSSHLLDVQREYEWIGIHRERNLVNVERWACLNKDMVRLRGYIVWCREAPTKETSRTGRDPVENAFTKGKSRNDTSCWRGRKRVT